MRSTRCARIVRGVFPFERQARAVARGGRRVLGSPGRFAQPYAEFDRLRWLYQGRRAIPAGEIHFRQPRPVSEADVLLSARLIDAYALAERPAPKHHGMWTHPAFQERQRALFEALQKRDPAVLAELLSSMFRSDFVLGMHRGSLDTGPQSRVGRRFAWLSTLSKVASLAESQGCARVENPEQGSIGLAFSDGGIETLMEKLEATLGVSLNFPEVGAAYGLMAAGRMITPDTPDQVYAARRLLDAIDTHLDQAERPPRIVEIGGGYGAMAYWLQQMRALPYVIVDLPIVNVLQGYFLAEALGHSQVSLYGEPPRAVTITPDHALRDIQPPVTVLANKDSMPEISRSALVGYLTWARSVCQGIVYSYNQEAAAPFDGIPQNVVPDIVAGIGGFTRIRRDPSWLRRGYVEEIYVPNGWHRTSSAPEPTTTPPT